MTFVAADDTRGRRAAFRTHSYPAAVAVRAAARAMESVI